MLLVTARGVALPTQSGDKTGSGSGGSIESLKRFLPLLVLIGLGGVSSQAVAGVEVRVESRPMEQPIDAYVLVKDGSTPVAGLVAQDFQVMLDGVPLDQFEFALPPREDPAQRVSVVLVTSAERESPPGFHPDYSALINGLESGDYVSVVRYWFESELPVSRFWGAITVLPFTQLDNGQGSEAISDFLQASAPTGSQDGRKYLLDGLRRGLREFAAPDVPLPDGPKAIVTIAGGAFSWKYSLSDVIGAANDLSIPIFNVGYGSGGSGGAYVSAGEALAKDTGGFRVRLARENGEFKVDVALAKMAKRLEDSYRITLPQDVVTDCERHVLEIVVRGEASSRRFVRCDTTPEPFTFDELTDVAIDTVVVSEPAIITGFDTAVRVDVVGGEYSIGCRAAFTSEPRVIQPGQSVCVRHRAASESGWETTTSLHVSGVSASFTSTTR
jgi:hypothetical protein